MRLLFSSGTWRLADCRLRRQSTIALCSIVSSAEQPLPMVLQLLLRVALFAACSAADDDAPRDGTGCQYDLAVADATVDVTLPSDVAPGRLHLTVQDVPGDGSCGYHAMWQHIRDRAVLCNAIASMYRDQRPRNERVLLSFRQMPDVALHDLLMEQPRCEQIPFRILDAITPWALRHLTAEYVVAFRDVIVDGLPLHERLDTAVFTGGWDDYAESVRTRVDPSRGYVDEIVLFVWSIMFQRPVVVVSACDTVSDEGQFHHSPEGRRARKHVLVYRATTPPANLPLPSLGQPTTNGPITIAHVNGNHYVALLGYQEEYRARRSTLSNASSPEPTGASSIGADVDVVDDDVNMRATRAREALLASAPDVPVKRVRWADSVPDDFTVLEERSRRLLSMDDCTDTKPANERDAAEDATDAKEPDDDERHAVVVVIADSATPGGHFVWNGVRRLLAANGDALADELDHTDVDNDKAKLAHLPNHRLVLSSVAIAGVAAEDCDAFMQKMVNQFGGVDHVVLEMRLADVGLPHLRPERHEARRTCLTQVAARFQADLNRGQPRVVIVDSNDPDAIDEALPETMHDMDPGSDAFQSGLCDLLADAFLVSWPVAASSAFIKDTGVRLSEWESTARQRTSSSTGQPDTRAATMPTVLMFGSTLRVMRRAVEHVVQHPIDMRTMSCRLDGGRGACIQVPGVVRVHYRGLSASMETEPKDNFAAFVAAFNGVVEREHIDRVVFVIDKSVMTQGDRPLLRARLVSRLMIAQQVLDPSPSKRHIIDIVALDDDPDDVDGGDDGDDPYVKLALQHFLQECRPGPKWRPLSVVQNVSWAPSPDPLRRPIAVEKDIEQLERLAGDAGAVFLASRISEQFCLDQIGSFHIAAESRWAVAFGDGLLRLIQGRHHVPKTDALPPTSCVPLTSYVDEAVRSAIDVVSTPRDVASDIAVDYDRVWASFQANVQDVNLKLSEAWKTSHMHVLLSERILEQRVADVRSAQSLQQAIASSTLAF